MIHGSLLNGFTNKHFRTGLKMGEKATNKLIIALKNTENLDN